MTTMDAARFEGLLLERLSSLCGTSIEPDTQLFAAGHLNSLRFVALLAFLETTLGRQVPTSRLSAEYFQTPRVITTEFYR
jgi:acyl carrier protein